MFQSLDGHLLSRPAASTCRCCCCKKTLREGVAWACVLLLAEALWALSISVARPAWEWSGSAITVAEFIGEDLARLAVLCSASRALWAFRASSACSAHEVAARVVLLFRVLVVLVLLEALSACLKWFWVESICASEHVRAARERRHPNMTEAQWEEAEAHCAAISILYDYVWQAFTVALLVYLCWIVHSYARELRSKMEGAKAASSSSSSSSPAVGGVAAAEVVAAATAVDAEAPGGEDAAELKAEKLTPLAAAF